jgi:hypothetical protein
LSCNECIEDEFGGLSVYLGHPWLNPEPAFSFYGWTPPLNLIGIWTAAGLGDVNGDGIDDWAVGALTDIGPVYQGWRGRAVVFAGDTSYHADARYVRPAVPSDIQVSVFPNPFNSSTSVRLTIPVPSDKIAVTAYNVLGQEVFRTEVTGQPPSLTFSIDAATWSSGIYILHVAAGAFQANSKMVVLK